MREDRPGLSWARNRGILEARAALIAYTDDDVTVDPNWLNCLIKPFSGDPSVVCVTGLTLPAELETPAQVWFEQYGGFGKGFTPQVFDAFRNRPTNRPTSLMYPYSAGIFGSGNNMAFRTGYLRSIGGFDPALGAGTVTGGGEDLSAFFKVITHGHTLMYEPAALNYHTHRRDYAGLSKQMYYYGTGLTAYLMKCLMDEPQRVFEVIGKIPLGLYYTLGRNSNKNAKKRADYPEELSRIELKGILHGPFTYLVSRKRMRTIINQFGRLEIVPGNAAEEMGSVPVPSLDIT